MEEYFLFQVRRQLACQIFNLYLQILLRIVLLQELCDLLEQRRVIRIIIFKNFGDLSLLIEVVQCFKMVLKIIDVIVLPHHCRS